MNIADWIFTHTVVGRAINPARKWISGKGTYLAALAVGIPALITIIQRAAEGGFSYLSHIGTTEEWVVLGGALAAIRLRGAITKAADPVKDPNVVPK